MVAWQLCKRSREHAAHVCHSSVPSWVGSSSVGGPAASAAALRRRPGGAILRGAAGHRARWRMAMRLCHGRTCAACRQGPGCRQSTSGPRTAGMAFPTLNPHRVAWLLPHNS